MLTPLHPHELVRALDGVLRNVAAPAMAEADPFARAQLLSAASIANYLAAELEHRDTLAERSRENAANALALAADAIAAAHPEAESTIARAAAQAGAGESDAVGDALAASLAALRRLGDDRDALDARRILQRSLAEIAQREVAIFASAEGAKARPRAPTLDRSDGRPEEPDEP